jgi:sugar diacid utilization regulator
VRKREPMGREDTAVRDAVERGLERGRSMAPPRQAATLVRHDHGLLVLGLAPRDAQPVRLAKVAADLQRAVVEAGDGAKGWRVVVGIGEPQKNPVDLHVSYRRARQAAEVAGLLESFEAVSGWWELGVYQTLLDLPLGTLTAESLHPGLRRLLAAREGPIWLQTLEAWFDLGCDARAAAEQLGLQRGSLYHRLNRIEQLAQVDLSRGDDRLALHLGLKIGRLAGLLS